MQTPNDAFGAEQAVAPYNATAVGAEASAIWQPIDFQKEQLLPRTGLLLEPAEPVQGSCERLFSGRPNRPLAWS
jgi:hypothetical protein